VLKRVVTIPSLQKLIVKRLVRDVEKEEEPGENPQVQGWLSAWARFFLLWLNTTGDSEEARTSNSGFLQALKMVVEYVSYFWRSAKKVLFREFDQVGACQLSKTFGILGKSSSCEPLLDVSRRPLLEWFAGIRI